MIHDVTSRNTYLLMQGLVVSFNHRLTKRKKHRLTQRKKHGRSSNSIKEVEDVEVTEAAVLLRHI